MFTGILPGGGGWDVTVVGCLCGNAAARMTAFFSNGRRGLRKFSNRELLDPLFPDVRMSLAEHRVKRHDYYRKQAADAKQCKAVVLYKESWVGVLHGLWIGKDSVEEG